MIASRRSIFAPSFRFPLPLSLLFPFAISLTFGVGLLEDDGELRREGRDELGHLAAGRGGLRRGRRRRRSGGLSGAGRRRRRRRSRILLLMMVAWFF